MRNHILAKSAGFVSQNAIQKQTHMPTPHHESGGLPAAVVVVSAWIADSAAASIAASSRAVSRCRWPLAIAICRMRRAAARRCPRRMCRHGYQQQHSSASRIPNAMPMKKPRTADCPPGPPPPRRSMMPLADDWSVSSRAARGEAVARATWTARSRVRRAGIATACIVLVQN